MVHSHSHSHHSAVIQVSGSNPVPGRSGVIRRDNGLDVAIIAEAVTTMKFYVIEPEGSETRYRLLPSNGSIWHEYIESYGAKTHYGFRVHGPWDPGSEPFYNPTKLLPDPYARGLEGTIGTVPAVHAHMVDEDPYPTHHPFKRSPLDSRGRVPYSVVVDNRFAVAPKPRVPWEKTIPYGIRVRGFMKSIPDIPPESQETYASPVRPVCMTYLKELGITSVELLPIRAKCEEPFLSERGLTNYWGYSTLSFFVPEASYMTRTAQTSGAQAVTNEFRGMVSTLHQASIEITLDIVHSHAYRDGDSGPSPY